jgi:hypothetical protein
MCEDANISLSSLMDSISALIELETDISGGNTTLQVFKTPHCVCFENIERTAGTIVLGASVVFEGKWQGVLHWDFQTSREGRWRSNR